MLLNPQADTTITAPEVAEAGGVTAGDTTTAVIPAGADTAAAIKRALHSEPISQGEFSSGHV